MVNLEELRKFKKEANAAGYESEEPKNWTKEADGSNTILYESGDWKFHDNFFGGEPYGGRTIISYKGKPEWIMVYYGYLDDVSDPNEVYSFLRAAMRAGREGDSFRGPKEFREDKFKYENTWQGNLENYSGKENIYMDGNLIYTAAYMGGLVDQRAGD